MTTYSMLAVALLGVVATSVMAAEKAPQNPDLELATYCNDFPEIDCIQELAKAYVHMQKRKSAYMRFGRSNGVKNVDFGDDELNANMEKRKSAYMRFGKRSGPSEAEAAEPEMEKRKSAYMRFGKRKSAYMRFGKRSVEDFEAESAPTDLGLLNEAPEKRKSAYMRFGKK